MGGNLVLIQKECEGKLKNIIEDFDKWLKFWFEWIHPWTNIKDNSNRVVWTRC